MQIEKAKALVPFVGVLERVEGRIVEVYTPAATHSKGMIGPPRHTIISIHRNGDEISLVCRHYHALSDVDEGQDCPACLNVGSPCYHVLACVLAIAKENGCSVVFSSDRPKKGGKRILHIIAGRAEAWVTLSKNRKG